MPRTGPPSGPPNERSGTVARLGEERADELRTLHDRLLTGPIEAHGGRVLKSKGDGLVASLRVGRCSDDLTTVALRVTSIFRPGRGDV